MKFPLLLVVVDSGSFQKKKPLLDELIPLLGRALAGQLSPLPNAPTNAGTRNGPINYNFPSKQYVANHVRIFKTGPLDASGAPALTPLTNTLPR